LRDELYGLGRQGETRVFADGDYTVVGSSRMHDSISRLAAGRFMVTRTDRLGDMILTGPLFDGIKQSFPRSHLTVLASAVNAAVAGMHPAVDEVIVDGVVARDSGWRGTLALARVLRRHRPDVIMFANAKHRLAVAALLARIPIRIGSARRLYSILYTQRMPASAEPDVVHETDLTLSMLGALGVDCKPGAAGRLQVPEADRGFVDTLLAGLAAPGNKGLAVVHPSNSGNALNASTSWYARLVDELAEAGYTVVLTGTEADREHAAAVVESAHYVPLDLSGRLSVGQLAALHARSSLCVGSSTGPTHLAAAVGAPTVGLYAPLSKQQKWLPRGAAVAVLQPEVGMTCPSCLGPRCRHYNCMELIPTRDVVAAGTALTEKMGSDPTQSCQKV
jgi:ADP-heptose:LPS heptosyltransferase